MDSYLFGEIQKGLPKFNADICNGLAVKELQLAKGYVEAVMKCASKSLPEELEFVRIERCTPEEEYRILAEERYQKRQIDISPSDLFMCKYYFRFNGEMLEPQYLLLPYATDGGCVRINGTPVYISPVLTDKAFSVSGEQLFVPLTRAKLTFSRDNAIFKCNFGDMSGDIVRSKIYNGEKERPILPPIALYLFAEFGFQGAMEKLFDAVVEVGTTETINQEHYTPGKWKLCDSFYLYNGATPSQYGKRKGLYTPSHIRVAVRAEDWSETMVDYMATFFWLVDMFPDRITSDECADPRLWRIILGSIVKNSRSEGKLANEMDVHMDSLSHYIDDLVIAMFKRENYDIQNMWEFLHFVIENMQAIQQSTDVSSMYGKRFVVLRYVLFDITKDIFSATFNLVRNKNSLTKKSIEDTLRKQIQFNRIVKINDSKHGETSIQQISGDSMLLKVTGTIVQQARANEGFKTDGTDTNLSLVAHSSIAVATSHMNQPGSDPTGRSSVSPFCPIDNDHTVVKPEPFKGLIDSIDRDLCRNKTDF